MTSTRLERHHRKFSTILYCLQTGPRLGGSGRGALPMDFPFESAVSKETSLVVTTFQAAGTVLLALLLRLLARGIPGRFLHYWSIAWVALGVALLSLNLSFLLSAMDPSLAAWFHRPALITYCVSE